jgi:hypothetical protein
MTVCTTQPANFAGIAAVRLAEIAMSTTDYTIANATGAGGGRGLTVGAKSTVPVTVSGTAQHVCIDNGTLLLYVTTCAAASLTNGGQVNIPTWKVEIADPV